MPVGQRHQMLAGHRGQLVGMPEGELAQEDPQHGRGVHLVEHPRCPTGARSRSASSMLSAPRIIAAMIEVAARAGAWGRHRHPYVAIIQFGRALVQLGEIAGVLNLSLGYLALIGRWRVHCGQHRASDASRAATRIEVIQSRHDTALKAVGERDPVA